MTDANYGTSTPVCKKELRRHLAIEDHPAIVKQKSRDFFWYSPVLKKQLDQVTGDLVITPRSEAEVIRVLKVCYANDVPVTVRGGRHRQLRSGHAACRRRRAQSGRTQQDQGHRAGAAWSAKPEPLLSAIDDATRPGGQELRLHPSTYRTATIGGFIAGGSGGIGSIRWGGLRDLGNVIRARVITMEAEPRVLDMAGADLAKVLHAYGTNGVITEVGDAADCRLRMGGRRGRFRRLHGCRPASPMPSACRMGILLKELGVISAPLPHDYFLRHRKYLRPDQSVCVMMVAPVAMPALAAFAEHRKADIVYRSDTADPEEKKGLPPVFELSWNHTTLRGLRVDSTITYLQILYPYPDPDGEGGGDDEALRQRVAGTSGIRPLRRKCHLLRSPGRALHQRRAAGRDHPPARAGRLPGLQSAPLHAGRRRHEADRRAAARFQARGRSQGIAQSGQDDRLGRSELRFLGRRAFPLSRLEVDLTCAFSSFIPIRWKPASTHPCTR